MSSVRAVPPSLPNRPPAPPMQSTYVQMPPPIPQRVSTVGASTSSSSPSSSSSSSSHASSSSLRSPSVGSPPPVRHASSEPSMTGRTFDYSDYSDFDEPQPHNAAATFAPPQPARSSSSSTPARSHPHPHPHAQPHPHPQPRPGRPSHHHQLSAEDRLLAYRLQREEESRASEDAIRAGLTSQFAKAAGRPVDEVDLSALTLDEAQRAIEIQLQIRADDKRKKAKKGLLGGLKARLGKPRQPKPNTSPTAGSRSATHLSVSVAAGADGGRQSPSPSPLPANVDVDAMSYEELLALSEAIGDVKSKGMSDADIERLPTATWERKRAEGEPEDEPEPPAAEAQADGRKMDGEAGDGSDEGKAKEKKKKGFFARMRSSSKAKQPQPISPLPPLSAVLSPRSPPADDPKSEKAAAPIGAGAEQWRDTCSICLESFRTGELVKFLPCFHHFHAEELDNWLVVNASCPICKEKPNVN